MSLPRSSALAWDWAGIKGVQIAGNARAVTDDEESAATALRVYSAKFPFVKDQFMDLIENSVVLRFAPNLAALAG